MMYDKVSRGARKHREVWWGIWRRVARHDEVDEVWWSMVRFDEMMKCDEAWHFGWVLQVVMDESGGFKLSCWVAKLGGHSCTSCPKKGHPVGRLLLELRRWFQGNRRRKCRRCHHCHLAFARSRRGWCFLLHSPEAQSAAPAGSARAAADRNWWTPESVAMWPLPWQQSGSDSAVA